ncbi:MULTISPECIES: alpha/beta hydrolase [Streptomyces]|uniref:Prolyl oligopeptidase family serine peptidase n=1 Tax=Streptomyces doudnae TaxID=3075536 RepID=A0ABD5EW52_9ACTN|nr:MULTISPECIES: prolyl oligopeptidase family serine peptidase [unclassified Streptomyces]MDT0438961.1 prolyl oligopeptidase family serine peptidase [Streptomyces sp. DSM 41981]MYQ66759.1 prolyl oligopeptidase family serine peptidase [Streptomyces sp. SID4950]SCE24864.1 Prolyl oligopeptidase family protein [Streptomyces sp. SolWspMP-5a-2]
MPDDAAASRAAAEEASALSHPAVAADVTVAYGDHPDQVIDLYAPHGDDRPGVLAPLVVALHGGAWRTRFDRRHLSPFASFLARRGFAVASVEYRCGATGPGADDADGVTVAGRWPETFDDVAAALDALPALVRGALPRADSRRLVLTGHSAGGHLALWAAARHLLPADAPWRTAGPPPLRGVVALAPIADFEVAEKLAVCAGAARQLLGGEAVFEERRPYADPALLLPTGIATTLVQGRADGIVPYPVAEAYADAAAKAGEVVGLTLLEDVGHFPLIDPAADACAVVAEEIAQLAF